MSRREAHRAAARISPATRRLLPTLSTALSTGCVDAVAARLLSSPAEFPDARALGHFGRAVRLQGKGDGRFAKAILRSRFRPLAHPGSLLSGWPRSSGEPRLSGQPGNVSPGCHDCGMRPALRAGLLPVWRNRDTLQIGVNPRRAMALSGIGTSAAVLTLLDGSRDWTAIIEAAGQAGVPAEAAQRVLGLLAGAGALAESAARPLSALPADQRGRLAPELATASLAYGDSDGGARTLARRRAACVRVHGAGRVGSGLASLLAAAGIGRIVIEDAEITRPQDLTPAGLSL